MSIWAIFVKLRVEYRLGLLFVQFKVLHQLLGRIRFAFNTNDFDRPDRGIEDVISTFEEVNPLAELEKVITRRVLGER